MSPGELFVSHRLYAPNFSRNRILLGRGKCSGHVTSPPATLCQIDLKRVNNDNSQCLIVKMHSAKTMAHVSFKRTPVMKASFAQSHGTLDESSNINTALYTNVTGFQRSYQSNSADPGIQQSS